MNAERDVERLLSDWLVEEAPSGAPDRIVLAASDRIDHTKQRRLGAAWRSGLMRVNWQLATAAVVGVLIIVLGAAWMMRPSGGVGGPVATPSPTPTAASSSSAVSPSATAANLTGADLTANFTSTLHGYSVRYPDAWTVTPATETWVAGVRNAWGSGMNDELSLPDVARFSGASQRLAEGQTAEEWLRLSTGYEDPSVMPTIDIGDQQGFIDADGTAVPSGITPGSVASGGVMYDVVVVVDGRGYNFNMDGVVDRSSFEAMLASVTFDAGSAVDATPTPSP
ncbi:MAG TPA: hypothetical protein VIF84_07525 [Candidatus Limnocylindrales bacterium]|jgi:hypothetical protein